MSETPQPKITEKSPVKAISPLRVLVIRSLEGVHAFLYKHPIISCLIGIYLFFKLIGTAWSWVLTPTINSNPQDPITLRGTFPFDKGFDLVFSQRATTTTPWVNRVCGMFVTDKGIPCHAGYQEVHPKKIDKNHYEITFYRDYYLQGIAGWVHGGFGQRAYTSDTSSKGTSGLGPQTNEMKCFDNPKDIHKFNGALICVSRNEIGPSIYSKTIHQAEINFRLESELQSESK